ncbi:MAG: hypothetical protein AAGC55_25945, partial [Myxococcota bacterium]
DAQGVYPSGLADLTLDPSFYVIYTFTSPARAKRPADLPIGVEHKSDCKLQIWADRFGVRAQKTPESQCEEPRVGLPRCTAAEVWKRAVAKGAPGGNAVATLGFWDWDGKRRWYINVGDAFSNWVADTCE